MDHRAPLTWIELALLQRQEGPDAHVPTERPRDERKCAPAGRRGRAGLYARLCSQGSGSR